MAWTFGQLSAVMDAGATVLVTRRDGSTPGGYSKIVSLASSMISDERMVAWLDWFDGKDDPVTVDEFTLSVVNPPRAVIDTLTGSVVAVEWGRPDVGAWSDTGVLLSVAACGDGSPLGVGEACPCGDPACVTALVGAAVGFCRQVDLNPWRLAAQLGAARVMVSAR
jgi:hypothetical protein